MCIREKSMLERVMSGLEREMLLHIRDIVVL